MINEVNENINNTTAMPTVPAETQYVDEFRNPIDPSLIDENGNYIGEQVTQYVDEFGNPIDPSLIDENGNYIGPQTTQYVDETGNPISENVQSSTIDHNELASQLSAAGELEVLEETGTQIDTQASAPISAGAQQMNDKELITGMVTFDYNNVPITDIVNSIILDSINKGASDIHFDPFDDGIKIRLRVDGQLNDYSIVPLYVKKNMITRIKIISGMNITESRVPQDGAIRTELQNKTIDLRVSCLPTNMGEKIVIRIMDYSMSAQGIDALDFSEENLGKIKRMLELPNGIILVTGATGSGKSTTVYSMLQKLNVEDTNLITVEDPIEMNIGGINQVQAVAEIGLTFATVLRSILRQDPDVIMIGEIRDDETARIAVRASITGHLVLSTIHTNNSLSTIERLTDMSVERYLLGSALAGIVSQKLSRRLCEKCKKLRPTTDYEKNIFKQALHKDVDEIYEAVGCPECSRGYRGRIAIHEVLLLNQGIKDAITKGADKADLRNLVYSNSGTDTMLQDGLRKAAEGKTSFEEVLKLVDLEDDLGTGTQLGLEAQIEASNMNMISEKNGDLPEIAETSQDTTKQIIHSSDQPININISPEALQAAFSSLNIPPQIVQSQPMYVPYPVTNENIDNLDAKIGTIDNETLSNTQLPQQPMYIPYPVINAQSNNEDEEHEIIVKPKKKAKKKTVVEIDPEDLFEDEIITKVKKVKKKKIEIEEIEDDEPEVVVKKIKKKSSTTAPKEIIIEEDDDEKENNLPTTPLFEEVEELEELNDLLDTNILEDTENVVKSNENDLPEEQETKQTLSEKNHNKNLKTTLTKKINLLSTYSNQINKKQFNIKTNSILNDIEELYNKLNSINEPYTINNTIRSSIKKLQNILVEYININHKDIDAQKYIATKERITNLLGIDADNDINTQNKILEDTIKMVEQEFPTEEDVDLSILDEIIKDEKNNLEPISLDYNIPEYELLETDYSNEEKPELESISITEIEEDYEILEDTEEVLEEKLEGISIDSNPEFEIISTNNVTFEDKTNNNMIADDKINNLLHELTDEGNSNMVNNQAIDNLLDELDNLEEM